MAFALDPEKTFSLAVHTVALTELENAIKTLKKKPNGLHEAIHDARKKFKRVRGLYRLVSPAAKNFAQTENIRIREIAHTFSAVRDAVALLECIDYLRAEGPDGETDIALSKLRAVFLTQRTTTTDEELQEKTTAAIQTCHEAIVAVSSQHFGDNTKSAAKKISKSWKKELSNAHVALMSAQVGGHDEEYHELRKRAQNYWMFCSLVKQAWPSTLKLKQNNAKTLADTLGSEHDLSILLAVINKANIDTKTREVCCKAADTLREHLRKRSIKMARKVFSDEAETEARIIQSLWQRRQSLNPHHRNCKYSTMSVLANDERNSPNSGKSE